jgi:hypothetical protein
MGRWFKQSAMLSFAFMITVSGKISLGVFGGSASHDFFKNIIQFELPSSL